MWPVICMVVAPAIQAVVHMRWSESLICIHSTDKKKTKLLLRSCRGLRNAWRAAGSDRMGAAWHSRQAGTC
jgi:hypothetical protein